MMLDKIICITFVPVQNKYPATSFIRQNVDKKRYIDNQKVQISGEIKINTQLLVLYAKSLGKTVY